jgi:chemotaxis protein methyltransferase CheR
MTLSADFDLEVRLLLEAIFSKYNYDFRGYSKTSVHRRVQSALEQMGFQNVSALQERVIRDPKTFHELLQFLTVPTSEMFRDPAYFRVIREKIVPVLRTYPSFKIWIAGCSTGEEAYSFSILLHEEGLGSRAMIYATDINPRSLKMAERGIFAAERIREYTQNYQASGGRASLADYFEAHYGAMLFDKKLKENIVFADHSLATDEVFAETVLVSCRNVMIYFDDALQNRALRLFYESLSHKGFLGIGMKESLRFTAFNDKFEELYKEEKIYRRI